MIRINESHTNTVNDTKVLVKIKPNVEYVTGTFEAKIVNVNLEKVEDVDKTYVKVYFEFEDNGLNKRTFRRFPVYWSETSFLRQFLNAISIEIEDGQEFDFAELIGLQVRIQIEEVTRASGAKFVEPVAFERI